MSRTIKLGLVQFNPTVGDISGNVERICNIIRSAKKESIDLLAFPELSVTGYPPEDLLYQKSFVEANLKSLSAISQETNGICVIIGFVDQDNYLFNASCVIKDNIIVAVSYTHLTLPTIYSV